MSFFFGCVCMAACSVTCFDNGIGDRTDVDVCRLDGKHVVFGKVCDGFDVVKSIEAVGSQSGKTSKPVMIADCGQL